MTRSNRRSTTSAANRLTTVRKSPKASPVPATSLTLDTEEPLVIASILRPEGITGVHTHVREFSWYLDQKSRAYALVTPFTRGRALSMPVFGLRPLLQHVASPAGVAWYRYWHTAFLANALRRRLAGLGPAVIYAQGPEAARATILARQGHHQRVVMAVHFLRSQADGWVNKRLITADGHVARAIERSEREIVAHLDGIVYVSRATRDEFIEAVPQAAEIRSEVVHNFVRPVQAITNTQYLADLVTVGSLSWEKNQEFLLRVLALAKQAGRPYTLDIYGTGPLRQHLKRTADDLGLAGQVRFRGFDPYVRTALPAYRAYVHACPVETGPIALIEALAAGLPVVAAPQGGTVELFSDGAEGRYWPLHDPNVASHILIDLLEDETARQAAACAASARFRTFFDARLVGPRLEAFLTEKHVKGPRYP